MYLYGNSCFEILILKNVFQVAFIFFLISEILIWIYTFLNSVKHFGKKQKKDKGSFLVIVAGFTSIIYLNSICRKRLLLVMPVSIFWVGILFIILGVLLRVYSVWTLGKSFTLTAQVNSEQKIVQTGPYKYLRHPAYSGSILTLIGIALAFRSFIGVLGTLIIIAIIYGYRIFIEEKLLENNFGTSYEEYKKNTSRIIPHIW